MAILFVGNGINRNEGISVSWDELLKKLYAESTSDISDALGMTLRYEYIDSETATTGINLKKKISSSIRRTSRKIIKKPASIHQELMGLPFDCILTTNYDYALELSVDTSFSPEYHTREVIYSFRRYQESAGKRVYHIHGECKYPRSICLGFEHYAGMLEKMRAPIVKSTKKELGGEHIFHLYDVLNDLEAIGEEWYYRIFTDDIYFLGFGFDQSEEDIWWLLTYRRRLLKEYPNLIKNKIYLLDITLDDERNSTLERAKQKVLESMRVEIIHCMGNTYPEKYQNALKHLKAATASKEFTYV